MLTTNIKNILLATLGSLFLILTICVNNNTPTATLSIKITQLQEYLKHNKSNKTTEELAVGIKEIIKPVFDLEEMSRRSLGANWVKLNESQQKEFTELFSNLLLYLYIGRLKNADQADIKFTNEDRNESSNISIVYTKITTTSEGTVEINYKLMLKEGEWKIYDVIIENIGLVANYRSEFAAILNKVGSEGLLQKLRDKTNRVHAS